MVTVGDILRVVDVQSMDNIDGEILNTWYFEVTAAEGSPVINLMQAEFEAWWNTYIMVNLTLMQTQSLHHIGLRVDNMNAYETEFLNFSYADPYDGQVGVDFASSATAWSFRLNRLFRTTRNGSKRFAGVPDTFSSNNVPSPEAMSFATGMETVIESPPIIGEGSSNEISVRLVIYREASLTPPIASAVNPVASVTFRGVGTQNTRKQLLT